jgi:sortase A
MRWLRRIERSLFILGVLLISIVIAAHLQRTILSRTQLQRFENVQTKQKLEPSIEFPPESRFKLDFSLWSAKRIAAYEQILEEHIEHPSAVLRISKLHLEVPVFEGTDELTLNRGVGHIAGTGRLGKAGNIGIAGHRDGFFRVLKDIGPGDRIELMTPDGMDIYTVDQIVLVRPNDVSVLDPRPVPSLTLVTCYPFYFIGSAPQRYIVQASITGSFGSRIESGGESRVQISEH